MRRRSTLDVGCQGRNIEKNVPLPNDSAITNSGDSETFELRPPEDLPGESYGRFVALPYGHQEGWGLSVLCTSAVRASSTAFKQSSKGKSLTGPVCRTMRQWCESA